MSASTSEAGVVLASQPVVETRTTRSGPVVEIAARLRDLASRVGVGPADAYQLLDELAHLSDEERALARTAVPCVFGATESPCSARAMKALGHVLGAHFDEQLDLGALDRPIIKVVRMLRRVFAAIVISLAAWIVFGGLMTGQTALSHDDGPGLSLAILGLALVALGLLEAAHIGAASLAGADVSALEGTHQRLQGLHSHINTKDKLEHYLGARQFGVVLVVFVIAVLTHFNNMNALPGTGIPIPHALQFLLAVGAPGALVVLTLAQVAPQVIAAQQPAALMNHPIVAGAFYCTLGLGTLGLAKPGAWIVAAFRRHERIPSAPRVRYDGTTRDVDGHGVVTIHRDIVVSENGATLEAETAVAFHESRGLGTYVDSSVTLPDQPQKLGVRAVLRRAGEVLPTVPGSLIDEPFDSGALRLRAAASPVIGAFKEGDVLVTKATAVFATKVDREVLLVDRPVHTLLLRVRLEAPPVPFPPATLTIAKVHDDDTGVETVTRERVGPVMGEDGVPVLQVSRLFPEVGTRIELSWGEDS